MNVYVGIFQLSNLLSAIRFSPLLYFLPPPPPAKNKNFRQFVVAHNIRFNDYYYYHISYYNIIFHIIYYDITL